MKRIIYILLFICTLSTYSHCVHAQTDPDYPFLILGHTKKEMKSYKNQIKALVAESGGHKWLEEEIGEVSKFLIEFNNYLNEFQHTIAFAAQIYGFYYESKMLCTNIQKFGVQLEANPTNAVALALHKDRNDMYIKISTRCADVAKTLYDVFFDKKMTENERIELAFSIRPKLQAINSDLSILTKYVKYTNMACIWQQIVGNTTPVKTKKDIALRSLKNWKISAKSIKPNK